MQGFEYDLKKEKRKIIPLLRNMIAKCTACGLCLQNCVFHFYSKKSSKKIMKEIKEFLQSKNLSKKMSKNTKKYIWTCGICEHCLNKCPLSKDDQVPRSILLILLRAILVIQNEAPFVVRFLRKHFFKDINNPILRNLWPLAGKLTVPGWYNDKDPNQVRERKAIEKARRYPTKGAEVCFFGGCGHTWAAPDVVYGMIRILEEAGIDFVTIGSHEFCCGVIYLINGFLDLWFEQTYKVLQHYLELKPRPKIILLHCPGCSAVLDMDLSKYGLILPMNYLKVMPEPIKLMHVTEYTLQLLKEKKIELKNEVPLTVTYNDNCSVGRRRAATGDPIYDKPRELLQSIPGLKLVESKHNREDAYCCGAIATKLQGLGTNLGFIGKDSAYMIQKEMYEDMLAKGSSNLITPCMGCSLVFEDSARVWQSKLGTKINVYDVNELVTHSMGIKVPRRHMLINDAIKLSLPFVKLDALKIIPRIIKTHGFRNIFKFIKETVAYIRKKGK